MMKPYLRQIKCYRVLITSFCIAYLCFTFYAIFYNEYKIAKANSIEEKLEYFTKLNNENMYLSWALFLMIPIALTTLICILIKKLKKKKQSF